MVVKNTIIFVDGQKIEDLDELANIAAGCHMKILFKEDKLVLVKVSTASDSDSDGNAADD